MEHLERLETIGSAAQVTNQARSTNGGAQTVQLPRRSACGRVISMEIFGDPWISPLVNSHIFLQGAIRLAYIFIYTWFFLILLL